jgi:hypothetical protein
LWGARYISKYLVLINDFFLPEITVSEGESMIEIEVSEKLYHAAGAVHV